MMNFQNKQFLIIIGILLVILFDNVASNIRKKRFLTFPRTSPTRLQLIMGIGIPVDLEIESVTIGYVLKAEYFLPENASNYINFIADPFDLTTRPIGNFYRKRREDDGADEMGAQLLEEPKPTEAPAAAVNSSGFDSVLNQKYEKYAVPAIEVESGTDSPPFASPLNRPDGMSDADYWNQEDRAEWLNDPLRLKQPQNLDMSRWIVYKGIATMAESKGLNGRACVLRSICESAHASFDYSNGILGELMHVVMTPSATKDELRDHSDNEYLRAEELGRHGAPCHKIFKECGISILDQFSGIYTPIMDIVKMLG